MNDDLNDALDALESMVEQYPWSKDGIEFDHYFMVRLRPDRWELTPDGVSTSLACSPADIRARSDTP